VVGVGAGRLLVAWFLGDIVQDREEAKGRARRAEAFTKRVTVQGRGKMIGRVAVCDHLVLR